MKALLTVAVIMPALNEAAVVAKTVSSTRAKLGETTRIVVVDDGSTDATAEEAELAGAHVVRLDRQSGYDAALAAGFGAAAALDPPPEILIAMDADGQHDLNDAASLLAVFDDPAVSMVVGSREKAARAGETIFRLYGRWCYGIADPLCGEKAVRRDVYLQHRESMNSESIFTQLAFDVVRAGHLVRNHAISIIPRADASRFGGALRSNLKILSALWRLVWRDLILRMNGSRHEV